ncbi:MAG: hypothetical protein JOZ75_08250 [Candidatus Dormibacteraeota bacterium]|nr:hypothetical protein [Candidatus Dormibacteraeota bacterium]
MLPVVVGAAGLAFGSISAAASPPERKGAPILPDHILVTKSVFHTDPNITAGVTQLPPGCGGTGDPCGTAVTSGDYPYVFNNDTVDGFFGVTSPISLEEINHAGHVIRTIDVPDGPGGMVTSFSSKSELSLNLSTGGNYVTFMGYAAGPAQSDVSNGSTPGDIDPTDGDGATAYRVVGQLDAHGRFHFTETNAYSGDNGRGAILNEAGGVIYATGNAGNGSNPEPKGVVMGAGAQLIQPSTQPESAQTPGQPQPVGSFNVNQLGYPLDKSAKDDNFRGMTVSGNVLYYTKGSGGNGIDTVYFVDPTGTSCPAGGVGLPASGATLPTTSTLTFQANLDGKKPDPGIVPENMCILKGFPTTLASHATDASDYPFGIWFASPTVAYVADEGAGDNTFDSTSNTYTAAAASTTAGLQKWVYDSTAGQWNLAYTLQNGLDLGRPYTVAGYPTGLNDGPGGTKLPWAPATGGLRNITGRVNPNGTATVWATTSTVSGSGDQGADPDKVVSIKDALGATALPSSESFRTLRDAANATIYRGVAFTPGTSPDPSRGRLPDDGDTVADVAGARPF